MSITLDATLKTAQDGINHRPIIEIISSPMAAVLPTTGNYFNSLSATEAEPHIILLSSGRLAVIMERAGQLKYMYTPTDRSEFIEVNVSIAYASNASNPCICELTDGNIGIVFIMSSDLYYKIISPTGTIVQDYTKLYETGSNWVGNPFVITLANDTYLMVYPEGTGTPPDIANTYTLKQRTSSDFITWSDAIDITPAAFNANYYCNNPNLLQIASGRIFLMVDYLNDYTNETELNNIYYMVSDNNGITWSAATKITDYTEPGITATHPTMAETENGDITFMYAERAVVKSLDKNMTGYPLDDFTLIGMGWPNINYHCMQYKADSNEIHIVHGQGITIIDAGTWEWKKTLTSSTIPRVYTPAYCVASDNEWIVYKLLGHEEGVQAYNSETDEVKFYHFKEGCSHLDDQPNYEADLACGYADPTQAGMVVATHDSIQKLFILHHCSGYGALDHSLGWIDLNEIADPITGYYTYTELWESQSSTINLIGGTLHSGSMKYDYTHDYLITHTWGSYAGRPGICVWNMDGTVVLELDQVNNAGFPRDGAQDMLFVGDDIYFSFPYKATEPDRKGLGHWRAVDGSIVFHQPTHATYDDYMLMHFVDMGDGRILMNCHYDTVLIFDTATEVWTVFNDDVMPGFGVNPNYGLAYDPTTKTIFGGRQSSLIAFSEYGPYSTLLETDIDHPDDTIDFGDYITFSYNNFEYQPNIVYDPDAHMWGVWQHMNLGSEYSAMWVNLIENLDMTDDLSINSPVSIEWDIENLNKLSFLLSRGHLYDPQNSMSTMSPFLKRNRKIVVRLGESVGGEDCLQDQGEFYVTSVKLEYSVDKYPEVSVTAEDLRIAWEDNEVIATEYYEEQSPHNVLENVLLNHGNMEAAELDIPATWETEHDLYHQFVDMNLDDIVKELMDHFGYFPFVNVDGKFEPRYIDLDKATDHSYSNSTQIIRYSPNDKYSTLINQVIVKGISHTYFEVLYEEENITSISGTTGWWGKRQDETVWYSEDHNRSCRYPRLEIIQSVKDFRLFKKIGGGEEYISATDEDEHYCVVMIVAPNLIPVLVATIAACVATYLFCRGICDGGPHKHGWCSKCNYAVILEINIIIYILSAIASYNYNIWARPIGHEKRTFQAQADDEVFQTELGGKIIKAIIDDPMCYTIQSCKSVAEQELAIVMAQRRRLEFQKTSHLQDEIGDIIEFVHPYSNETLKIFAANIKRSWHVGKECIDEIQGWRI